MTSPTAIKLRLLGVQTALLLGRITVPWRFDDRGLEREFRVYFTARGSVARRLFVAACGLVLLLTLAVQFGVSGGPVAGAVPLWPLQIALILALLSGKLIVTTRAQWRRLSNLAMATTVLLIGLALIWIRAQRMAAGHQLELPMEFVTALFTGMVLVTPLLARWRILLAVALGGAITLAHAFFSPHAMADGVRLLANITFLVIACSAALVAEKRARVAWFDARRNELLSNQDALTGLASRRRILEGALQTVRYAARHGKQICIAMVDVDHFKIYNDVYGHLAGDRCLQRVAEVIQRRARRPFDYCGRYGGEEFVLVWLFDKAPKSVQWLANSIVSDVRSLRIRHAASPGAGVVTVSIGLVHCRPGPSTTVEQLIQIADNELYAAKMAGRDRARVRTLLEGEPNQSPVHTPAPRSRNGVV